MEPRVASSPVMPEMMMMAAGGGGGRGGAGSECGGTEEPGICSGCGDKITDRYYLLAVEKQWHVTCLVCVICKLPLDSEVTCFAKDGDIYCKDDYYRSSQFLYFMSLSLSLLSFLIMIIIYFYLFLLLLFLIIIYYYYCYLIYHSYYYHYSYQPTCQGVRTPLSMHRQFSRVQLVP